MVMPHPGSLHIHPLQRKAMDTYQQKGTWLRISSSTPTHPHARTRMLTHTCAQKVLFAVEGADASGGGGGGGSGGEGEGGGDSLLDDSLPGSRLAQLPEGEVVGVLWRDARDVVACVSAADEQV